MDLQIGAQYKDIGAGMFYGFGCQDQFDATRTAAITTTEESSAPGIWANLRFSVKM